MPFSCGPAGVTLAVRLTPKASHNAIDGVAEGARGKVLGVRVTAVPEQGKANAALMKLLAKATGIPKSNFKMISGTAARHKTILIEGESANLMARLTKWLEGVT